MEVQVLFDSIDLDADDIKSGAAVTKDISQEIQRTVISNNNNNNNNNMSLLLQCYN